ncbi:hypothetical protein FRACYDRAFT_252608 [Fragilariopsis cylindrus CCMP1102]|uniref:Uncharacterized protein n=1 Tax=Fragilariopsis cylindrus CCMP1102 TaxID=635003 RepID=A0A1E7EME2_9STRA|nr:hypothetical protein FRACYDRAFT_252608 [Fragilariopsis cylindrus CCMP1102]|eukprot:OEU06976.1 hypothetical protein FRACYDRAFT_252608 [Fragilariopsis cylindrus CCMP1102]
MEINFSILYMKQQQQQQQQQLTYSPYVDGFMMTAQFISIVAFLISWIWWVTFIVGLICFVLLQVIWCCRQSKIGLYISAGLSTLAGITCTIAGIVMLVVWKDQVQCSVWRLTGGGNWWSYDYYSEFEKPDYCEERRWAVVAFVSALLWFITSGCILYFVNIAASSSSIINEPGFIVTQRNRDCLPVQMVWSVMALLRNISGNNSSMMCGLRGLGLGFYFILNNTKEKV